MSNPASSQTGQLAANTQDGQTIQVSDTIGTLFLGVISIILLLALLRAHKHIRKLLERQLAVKE